MSYVLRIRVMSESTAALMRAAIHVHHTTCTCCIATLKFNRIYLGFAKARNCLILELTQSYIYYMHVRVLTSSYIMHAISTS